MSAEQAQQQIIEEFLAYEDWLDKYNLLIEMGKDIPVIDPRHKTNNHLINGCQSRVWLHAELRDDGKVYFSADSDAVITKGMVSLLIRVLSGRTPDEILNTNLHFIDTIGLTEHLSPTRSNGLVSMIKQMKLYAQVFQLKAKN